MKLLSTPGIKNLSLPYTPQRHITTAISAGLHPITLRHRIKTEITTLIKLKSERSLFQDRRVE